MKDSFQTLQAPAEGLYKEKGSKFYSFAFPVRDEDKVKRHLQDLKKKYYDARHHCFAYSIGVDNENTRAYDDGEPAHSAGDPILGQIKSHQLNNTMIVVVRYFGGTKLGVGGLIKAYRTAAASAIQNGHIIEKLIKSELDLRFPYSKLNTVMRFIKENQLEIMNQEMDMECAMKIAVRRNDEKSMKERITNMYGVQLLE